MQVERSYIVRVVCPSCGGRGVILNPDLITTELYIICPACLGVKTQEVKVTEGIT